MSIVRQIIWSGNKTHLRFPFTGILDQTYLFGEGECADILGFGFSLMEHEDYLVESLVVSPATAKRIIKEIDKTQIVAGKDYFATLWTGKIYVSDKVTDNQMLFANDDISIVLDLDTNKTED